MDEKSAPVLIDKTDTISTPENVSGELKSPVIIFDFDYYYMGGLMAEYIKDLGHEVTLITPFDKVSPWSFNSNEIDEIQLRLQEKDIRVITQCRIKKVKDSSVKLIHKVSHEETDIDRGSLVLVGYREQNDSLFSDLNSREEDLKTSESSHFKILVTQMPLGQSCMLFLLAIFMPIHSIKKTIALTIILSLNTLLSSNSSLL